MNGCYEFKSSQPNQEDKECILNDIDEDDYNEKEGII
jgi:hypothetical protein